MFLFCPVLFVCFFLCIFLNNQSPHLLPFSLEYVNYLTMPKAYSYLWTVVNGNGQFAGDNRICYSSNRSKQIQETHTAFRAGTQYTRQSLNETQHSWLHIQQDIVCEAMYAVFIKTLPRILCAGSISHVRCFFVFLFLFFLFCFFICLDHLLG